MKVFFKKNLFILKLNNIKIIHNLYFQCLTQTLYKTTFFSTIEGVCFSKRSSNEDIKRYKWVPNDVFSSVN